MTPHLLFVVSSSGRKDARTSLHRVIRVMRCMQNSRSMVNLQRPGAPRAGCHPKQTIYGMHTNMYTDCTVHGGDRIAITWPSTCRRATRRSPSWQVRKKKQKEIGHHAIPARASASAPRGRSGHKHRHHQPTHTPLPPHPDPDCEGSPRWSELGTRKESRHHAALRRQHSPLHHHNHARRLQPESTQSTVETCT